MALCKIVAGSGGGGTLTPAIGGMMTTHSSGTGIKPFAYYNIEDASLVSYSNGKVIINRKGKYVINFYMYQNVSANQELDIGGVQQTVDTGYSTFTADLNVNDEIYFNRISGASQVTIYSMDVALVL